MTRISEASNSLRLSDFKGFVWHSHKCFENVAANKSSDKLFEVDFVPMHQGISVNSSHILFVQSRKLSWVRLDENGSHKRKWVK